MASADLDFEDLFDFISARMSAKVDVDAVFQKIVRQPYYGQAAFKYLRDFDELGSDTGDISRLELLRSHPDKFVLFERDNGRVAVVAVRVPQAKLCLKHVERPEGGCVDGDCSLLHVCRKFVGGHCSAGVTCPHDHNFEGERNSRLLAKLGLGKFDNDELRSIVSRSQLMVCNLYNRQEGHCSFKDGCVRLHICERYVRGECSGPCKLSHAFDETEHSRRLVKLYRLNGRQHKDVLANLLIERRRPNKIGAKKSNEELLAQMLRRFQQLNPETETKAKVVDEPTAASSAPTPARSEHLLTASRGRRLSLTLSSTTNVADTAATEPVWQMELFDSWRSFSDTSGRQIEEAFCNPDGETLEATVLIPEIDDNACKMTINFNNTNRTTARLSLPEPNGELTVNVKRSIDEAKENWLWYWQDDDSSWMPYLFESDQQELEASYKKGDKRGYPCEEKYSVKYSEWTQKNRETGKERSVRRRPLHV